MKHPALYEISRAKISPFNNSNHETNFMRVLAKCQVIVGPRTVLMSLAQPKCSHYISADLGQHWDFVVVVFFPNCSHEEMGKVWGKYNIFPKLSHYFCQ